MITKNTLKFLSDLKANNSREWMLENKDRYLEAKEDVISFADKLIGKMSEHDSLETVSGKKSLFRLNRDIRFSKDKSPYKINFGGRLRRATEVLRGGYYFHVQPGNSFIAGGFFDPSPDDLKHIRKQLEISGSELRDILIEDKFRSYFGELVGDKVKTAPKGFSIEDPSISLIRHKQFLILHKFKDEEVVSPRFHVNASDGFKRMRPFLDYMSEILITDLNGVRRV